MHRWFLFSLVGLVLVAVPVLAQGDAGMCSALVEQALEQMGENCSEMNRNSACYGYTRVDSSFAASVEPDYFSAPADRAALHQLDTIATAPLDLALDVWGVAVMNVQANVPATLPGQAVVFMLMGNTEVTNTVAPADAVEAVEPVNLVTPVETRIFSGPAANTSTVMIAPVDTVLPVDGLSDDGTWLRVNTANGPGWVRRAIFNNTTGLESLPAAVDSGPSPMQSFQVRTAFDDLLCEDAPSLLAIQSPEGITVDLTANGAHIHMGSLVMLRTAPPGNAMQVFTIEGDVVLDPDTPQEMTLPAGHITQRCLDDEDMVYDGCGWLPPLPMTGEQLVWAQTVRLAYEKLGTESIEIDNEPVTPVEPVSCQTGTTINHLVEAGDTLFRLSLMYDTTVAAIMANNDLSTTRIAAGQTLEIICGAREPVTLPPETPVDCHPFRATSPLDGLLYGRTTFYWDAAPGATGYRVNVFGESGYFSFMAEGSSTNLTADTTFSGIGHGFDFQWNVDALYNGEVACSTPLAGMRREAPATEHEREVPPPITPTPYCGVNCIYNWN